MRIGNREFDTENNTYIMGILNCTPDSFSDGGQFNQLDKALIQVEKMIKEGADIIDVGGESTKPGSKLVTEEEEMERVLPIIEGIKARLDTVISVDTYKAKTASEAIHIGADMVNDVWGLKADKKMAEVIAKEKVACCLMHNRKDRNYIDFKMDVLEDIAESIRLARVAGINDHKIIIDPGVGFAKNTKQNIEIIANVRELATFGYPVLLAASRKSVIGNTLGLEVDQRLEGTLVTTVYGVQQGCSFIRVHDVLANRRVIDMTRSLMHGLEE